MWWRRRSLTAETFQTFRCETTSFSYVVGTEFMDHAANGHRVREEFGYLPQAALFIDGVIIPRIEICVPIHHVDQRLLYPWIRVLEFGEISVGPHIVVILVDLPQGIAYFDMVFEVVYPMVFTAINRDPAVWTLKFDVSWGQTCFGFGGTHSGLLECSG